MRVALVVLALAARAASAQTENPALRGFDPDPARPAMTLNGGFVLETAESRPTRSWRAELLFDYAHGLLALYQGERKQGDLLTDRLQANLLAGYSFGRLQVGLGLPVAIYQRSNLSLLTDAGVGGAITAPVASFALGDLRGMAKYTVLDEATSRLLSLAVSLEARAPTGNRQAFFGDGPMVIPSVLASRRIGPARLDLNIGYVVRGQGQYLQLVAHDALAYGVGATIDLPKLGPVDDWKALVELDGQLPRGLDPSSVRYRAPLEARAGVRAHLWRSLYAELGAGAGIAPNSGYGREAFRVFGGLRWDVTFADRDGDGIPDDEDRCPDTPGQARFAGCPDGDSDGDGIPDKDDHCPTVAGPKELHGCPDSDGDGVPDDLDKCPKVAGPKEQNGCPDSDHDGIPDDLDKCPNTPGPKDLSGCPEGDSDGDGVPNDVDQCPNEPGPKELDGCMDSDNDGIPDVEDKCPKAAGPPQTDGCPVKNAPYVVLQSKRLELKLGINFDTGKDTIKSESLPVLDEVVQILSGHAEIKKVRVEGHTDNVGGAAMNKDLSQRRAQSVVRYLVGKGVAKERLTARGYGPERPVASNRTALGRAKNRRVEFTLLDENAPEEGEK